jgi:antitoxin (DNA-binding transcriptional repressor) of toxin-antitoxin stability system
MGIVKWGQLISTLLPRAEVGVTGTARVYAFRFVPTIRLRIPRPHVRDRSALSKPFVTVPCQPPHVLDSAQKTLDLVHFIVYILIMIRLNIHEAKTHLSRYLKRLAKGEGILLCKRNIPIAEIRPVPPQEKTKRPIGLAKGKFEVPPEFFEPLPPDVIASFHGESP